MEARKRRYYLNITLGLPHHHPSRTQGANRHAFVDAMYTRFLHR